MTSLTVGTPAPLFHAEAHINPNFALSSLGGLFVLLAFVPAQPEARDVMLGAIAAHRGVFDDERAMVFVILSDRADYHARTPSKGLRWFIDEGGDIAALYGADGPLWVLLDPTQRVLVFGGPDDTGRIFDVLGKLPPPALHTGAPISAPVLTVPRILEPELCQRLIAYYEADGGQPSGTMQQVDGRTMAVLSNFKRRRDAMIEEVGLQRDLRVRINRRLVPEIAKAFQFEATHIERYIVARYDAAEGGYFRPHRDNTTTATAHRKFAVSINLNSEDFEGGDLRFPEFGPQTYRPPTGGAVVFSCSLLHEATPVTKGVRYATLPFLYDAAGDVVRRANVHTLDTTPAKDPTVAAEGRNPVGTASGALFR